MGLMTRSLLGDGGTAGGTFPSPSGLSLTGFFFPLLQSVLRMRGQPTIRQESLQGSRVAGGDGRSPTQHVGQVRPNIYTVPPRALNQRVERRRRLAAPLASKE